MEDKYGNMVGNTEFQRREIIELVKKIKNPAMLIKIISFIEAWLEEREFPHCSLLYPRKTRQWQSFIFRL